MPRNACRRHPRKDVIEIPIRTRYCERCHHLVPPAPSIDDIIYNEGTPIEEPLEAELAEEIEAVEEVTEEALELKTDTTILTKDGPDIIELEAEPEPNQYEATEEVLRAAKVTEQPLEAVTKASEDIENAIDPEAQKVAVEAQEAQKAEIAHLKAKLAELEPKEE